MNTLKVVLNVVLKELRLEGMDEVQVGLKSWERPDDAVASSPLPRCNKIRKK